MSLHRLPPELLLNILRLLGSAFFHQDVRRLLVSKWWYQIAWPVFLQDLEFRAETLRSFILASERVGMVRSIQEYVITATLVLDGFENWDSAHSTVTATELSEIDFEIVNMWTSQLNGYAAAFAGILQQYTSYRYPSRCGFNTSDTFPQLKADMESSARELVFAMQSPRIVRILSHTFPGLALRSFDVLTERQMVLTPAAPWDADGEEVEDRVSTEDRFDSDSSSEEFLL
ncbi:hypothetical protein C2857_001154 [Epichloe festucae Fl1]|uniref:F-box domain-containing protein n=1 Tax=Epichloe festucae (strain Fl1) TaxID=877507 RepID=A0A7S9KUI9_EPIFF|nr:hypothetical protein C2857_001154 [Epichloe festucae Fl1]